MRNAAWLTFSLLCFTDPAVAGSACFGEAASRYRVPESLLRAISRVESGGNPSALGKNSDGSVDIGHMQINSRWLDTMARYGITSSMLWEPCTNTHAGAWILAQNIQRIGYSWEAIGAYNAKHPEKRMAYARKIATAILREEGR